jgi:hypothetical protein
MLKTVQISTAYGQQKEGSATLPRNKYVEVRPDKPTSKEEAIRPEFKTCTYTTEAIVSEGIDKGEIRKVCTEPTCPVHHPKPRSQKVADDPKAKAQEERQRREIAKKVDRRDVHPNPYVSVVVSCRPVPRVSHTEPSRSCLHPQWNLVRPLSLTEELRLCQNIEHYQLSI